MNNDENFLIAFKSICNFVNDLGSEYGEKHKPLKLYQRLINKTQISHDQIIKKHIDVYYKFCLANRDTIYGKDSEKLVENKIIYSKNVYIDMKYILSIADEENTVCIWKHLLTISAILDPTGKAKEILRQNVKDNKDSNFESNFLFDMINKVEKNIKPGDNPMDSMSSIMSSNIIGDLMQGVQGGVSSGKLDMGKLLGAVQGMVSSLNDQAGDDPESKQAMGMLNNMTSMIGNMQNSTGNGSADGMPDMMQMFSTVLGGMANNTSKIEDITNFKK